MSTSPQFRKAISDNLARIDALDLHREPYGTLGMYLKDYAKKGTLTRVKPRSRSLVSFFFGPFLAYSALV